MKKLLLTFITLSSLSGACFSQGLLSPKELTLVNQTGNTGQITGKLQSKGYQKGYGSMPNLTDSLQEWYFQTERGEYTDFSLRKLSKASGSCSLTYFISNAFYYQQFVGLLGQQKYPFKGVKIIDSNCYNSFSNGTSTFLTLQTKNAGNKTVYEIRLE